MGTNDTNPSTNPRPPVGLGPGGRRLWRSVVGEFDLMEHELAQLEEASFCRDRIAGLRVAVDADGSMIDSSQGRRLHPGIAEIRAQQLALARLLGAIGIPVPDDVKPLASSVLQAGRFPRAS